MTPKEYEKKIEGLKKTIKRLRIKSNEKDAEILKLNEELESFRRMEEIEKNLSGYSANLDKLAGM